MIREIHSCQTYPPAQSQNQVRLLFQKGAKKGKKNTFTWKRIPQLIHYPGTRPTRESQVQIPMYPLHRNEGLT